MKRFFTILLMIIFLIIPGQLKAESQPEDMSVFRIAILLSHCDQADEIKVVRLRNNDTQKVAFCLEPYVSYLPSVNEYFKERNDSKRIYDLYRAFEELGSSDEAFITVQLMIWEEVCGQSFTFDGVGAEDYLKAEVLQLLEGYEAPVEADVIDEETYPGIENTIEIQDIDRYDIESDVRITGTTQNSISYIADEYSSETLKIDLEPKSYVPEGAYTYRSEGSQNIYMFEGEYESIKPITINIKTLNDDLSVSFRKLDLNDQPISGAQFTLYKLSDTGEDKLYFLKAGSQIDLYEKLIPDNQNYDRDSLSIEVSERYEHYIDDGMIDTDETGYFPFTLKHDGEIINKGRVYVSDLIDEDFTEFDVETVKTVYSGDQETNTVNGLKPDNTYYLCESEPQKGYTYHGEPCKLISTYDDSYLEEQTFYNESRRYTLHLIKNDPDRTINLNGALFRLNYDDDGQEKEFIFRTGSLNISNEEGYSYLFYRHENDQEIKVKELSSDHYIEDDVAYGKYYYCLSNDSTIDESKLVNEITVKEGSFIIEDLPYSSGLYLEELEAPRGYFIDEAEFEVDPDISYSDITFRNSRINSFDIIPNYPRRIPKTCIGD